MSKLLKTHAFFLLFLTITELSKEEKKVKQEIKKGKEKETVKKALLGFVLSDFHWVSFFATQVTHENPQTRIPAQLIWAAHLHTTTRGEAAVSGGHRRGLD